MELKCIITEKFKIVDFSWIMLIEIKMISLQYRASKRQNWVQKSLNNCLQHDILVFSGVILLVTIMRVEFLITNKFISYQ